MKNKHLSATDRKDIEAGLNKNKTLTEIANSIDKSYNTVKYEIINHREKKYPSNFNGNRNLCMYFKDRSCKIKGLCNTLLPRGFVVCPLLMHSSIRPLPLFFLFRRLKYCHT